MSWLRVKTMVRRHVYVLWRSPNRWFDIAVWPLLDVLLFGSLGAFVASESDASRAAAPYLLAGIIMFHVLYQTQIALNTGFMEETWSRNLLNVMVTPLTEIEFVSGIGLFGFAKNLLALVTLAFTALVFFGFNLGSVGWALVPIGGILVLAGWCIAFIVIGLMLRYGQSAEIFAWGMNFVVMALSGVFNPVESMPAPLQPIARALPTTKAFEALRQVLDGEPIPWGLLASAFVGSLICLALSIGFCTHLLKVFRRRGFVTRFS